MFELICIGLLFVGLVGLGVENYYLQKEIDDIFEMYFDQEKEVIQLQRIAASHVTQCHGEIFEKEKVGENRQNNSRRIAKNER